MHRNRTWTLDPPEWRTQRNRLLPIEGGDGSTLNLDFTKGVLDPRLIFNRLGTATFVNSQGYVAYADTNLVVNSALVGSSQATNWVVSGSWDATIPSPGVRRVTTGATAQQKFTSCAVNITPGITYSVSIYVSEVSGQHYANTLTPTGTAVVSQFYLNGNPVGAYTTASPGLITAVFTTTAGTVNDIRMGIGSTGSNVANAVCEFSQPRCVPGNITQPTYFASPIDKAYQAPRFDYSPTTIGEPRGLLIEGQAINLCRYSSDPQLWVGATNIAAPVNGSGLAPDGVSIPKQLIMGSGSYHAQQTASTQPIGTYTFSVYLKAASPQQVGMRVNRQIDGTNSNMIIANVTTYWQRFSVSVTTNAIDVVEIDLDQRNLGAGSSVPGPGVAATFLMWGAQLESGSVATSHIPTGASSVTRPSDFITSASSAANSKATEFSINDFTANASSNTSYTYLLQYDRLPRVGNVYPAALYGRTTAGSVRIDFRDFSGTSIELAASGLNCFANYAITNTNLKVAIAQDGTTYPSGAVNGVVTTATSGTINNSSGCEWLQLGNSSAVSGSFNPIRIQKLQCIPRRLSNLQLQQITDPNYVAPTLDIDFVPMTTGADLTAKGITFTRLTNATFINTAGTVQYADANEIRNSTMLTVSNFTQSLTGGSPSVTINGNNTVTFASVAGIATWLQGLALVAGLPISFSIEVTALTNTDIRVSDMVGAGFGFTGQTYYYTNTSGVTSPINSLAVVSDVGLYTVTATTTGTYGNIIFGTGCNSFNKTGSVTLARPQFQYGTVVSRTNYFPNVSTAASYQGPRFNNAVLTSRANYIKQSNSFTTAPWVQKDGTHLATVTAAYEAAPPGFTGTATRITSSNAAAGITQALTLPAVSGKQVVISFYAKSNKTGSQACYVQANAGGIEAIEIPTTWTRVIAVNAAINSTLTEVTLYGLVGTLDFSIYGMQVEYVTTGSPLTAYIPTTTIGAISRTTKPRGILIEQATENLSLYSNTLYSGNWGASAGVTRSQDTLLPDPSGSNNACQITKASGYQYVVVNQAPIPTFTVPANSTRYLTGSVWLRVATSGQVPSIGIFDPGGTAFGTRYQARTDNDLVTISSGSGADIDITFGSVLDWVRVSVTRVFTNNTASPVSYSNLALYIYPNRQNENAATIYAWGTQMELASGATTYLPSVASASVRSLESCYLSGSNFTSWYNTLNPTGTFYTEFDRPEASATTMGNPVPVGFGDYAPGKLIMISSGESSIGTGMFVGIWTNINFFSGTVIGAVTRKESNKAAFSFNGPAMRGALNTTGLSNLITGAGSMNIKEVLYIGSDGTTTSSIPAASRDWLNSCIQRVVFYPTEFTPAQLTAIVS